MENDTRKRYAITCPHCQAEQYACKSIFHEMGILEAGRGKCLDCKGDMKLVYHCETDTMSAQKWEN